MPAQQRGSKWTPEEDVRLLELVEAGKSWVFISAKLKRPAKSIRDHLRHLRRRAVKISQQFLAARLQKAGAHSSRNDSDCHGFAVLAAIF
jgi:Myb-like DNA-binding domain